MKNTAEGARGARRHAPRIRHRSVFSPQRYVSATGRYSGQPPQTPQDLGATRLNAEHPQNAPRAALPKGTASQGSGLCQAREASPLALPIAAPPKHGNHYYDSISKPVRADIYHNRRFPLVLWGSGDGQKESSLTNRAMVLRPPFRVAKGGSGSRGIGWGCRAIGALWDWSVRAPAEKNPAFRRTPLIALPLRGRAGAQPYRCGALSPRGVSGVVVGVCGWPTGLGTRSPP